MTTSTTTTTLSPTCQVVQDVFEAHDHGPDHYRLTWDGTVWTMADAQRMAAKIERQDPSVTGRYGKGWGYFHERTIGDLWDPSTDQDRAVEITTGMVRDLGQIIRQVYVTEARGFLVVIVDLAPYYSPSTGEQEPSEWDRLEALQARMAETHGEEAPF